MDGEKINIDPSVLKEKKSKNVSLTDKYSVETFTDGNQKIISKVNKDAELEKEQKESNLFVGELVDEGNIYLVTKETIFLQEKQIVIDENMDETLSKGSYIVIGIIIALSIIVVLSYYKLRRSKPDEININHYIE